MNSTSNVQMLLEILHQEQHGHCMECPEDTWPCRTIRLLKVGLNMDRREMDASEDAA